MWRGVLFFGGGGCGAGGHGGAGLLCGGWLREIASEAEYKTELSTRHQKPQKNINPSQCPEFTASLKSNPKIKVINGASPK